MPRILSALTAIILIAAAAAFTRAEAQALTDEDRHAIAGVIRAYESEWLRGDSLGVLALFTDDAVLQPHHGVPPVVGLAAIRRFWWPSDAPPTRVTELELKPDEIAGNGELAYSRGRFRLAFSYEDEQGLHEARNAGNYLMVLRREGSTWKIARFIWNDPPPELS